MERICVLISKQDKAVSKRHGRLHRTATPSGGFTRNSAIYTIYKKMSAVRQKQSFIALKPLNCKVLQAKASVCLWGC